VFIARSGLRQHFSTFRLVHLSDYSGKVHTVHQVHNVHSPLATSPTLQKINQAATALIAIELPNKFS
jgi:hypothetical protein